ASARPGPWPSPRPPRRTRSRSSAPGTPPARSRPRVPGRSASRAGAPAAGRRGGRYAAVMTERSAPRGIGLTLLHDGRALIELLADYRTVLGIAQTRADDTTATS